MSAPTTAEVREALAKAGREVENCHHSAHEDGLWDGRYEATYDYALPIAEHRDALAAEVARLSADIEMFQRAAAQAEQTRRDLAAEVARLKAILECGSSPYGVHRCVHCDSEVT